MPIKHGSRDQLPIAGCRFLFGIRHLAFGILVVAALGFAQTPGPRALAVPKTRDILVSTDWLAKHRTDTNLVILHIAREKTEYDAGHVPGAVFLPVSDFLVTRNGVLNELPADADLQHVFERAGVGDDKRVIIYATGERSPILAARAWFSLDYLGHGDHAALLDGGLDKWKKDGRELSSAPAETKPAMLTIHPHPELVVDTARVLPISNHIVRGKDSEYVLLDSRPEDEYRGERAGEDVPRAGHIPGAISLYWPHLLDENGELLPPHDLREVLQQHGVTPDKRVVNYCRTGVQAAFDYFVLRYLGYDAMLYDGSFMEWSKAEGTKVDTGANH